MTDQTFLFIIHSLLFGVGLAMDAFSVSMANGLHEPQMPHRKTILVAGIFAVFQTAMPLLGWFFVHTVSVIFLSFQRIIPWIAFILLCFIGGKMLREGLHSDSDKASDLPSGSLGSGDLLIQGIATSIDALSVGFVIADFHFRQALAESLIIGGVTFGICMLGLYIGKRLGMKLSGAASLLGGMILILIGLNILIHGLLI